MSDKSPIPAKNPRARKTSTPSTGEVAAETTEAETVTPESVAPEPEVSVSGDPAESQPVTSEVSGGQSEEIEVVPAQTSATEPVLATDDPTVAQTAHAPAAPVVQTVYVHAPIPPKKRNNRGFGSLIALLSGILFAIVFAVIVTIVLVAQFGRSDVSFVVAPSFYVPILFFVVGFIVLALLANRAKWWAYVLGSFVVGVFVYFGTIGTLLLVDGIILDTPQQAEKLFGSALVNPLIIAAALLAREISLWVGAGIAARGRRLTTRNAVAKAEFERESAEKKAEYDRAVAASAAS